MANESSGSIPENLADDVPTDVDFNAVMARSQAQLVMQTGREFASNEDLRQKLILTGKLPPDTPSFGGGP